jgi:hypothetical protein
MIIDLAAGCAAVGVLVVCAHLMVMDCKHQTNLHRLNKEWEERSQRLQERLTNKDKES